MSSEHIPGWLKYLQWYDEQKYPQKLLICKNTVTLVIHREQAYNNLGGGELIVFPRHVFLQFAIHGKVTCREPQTCHCLQAKKKSADLQNGEDNLTIIVYTFSHCVYMINCLFSTGP